jgi:outer membrane protein
MGRAGKNVASSSSSSSEIQGAAAVAHRPSFLFVVLTLAVLLLGARGALAQTVGINTANPDSVLTEALNRIEGEPLTLAEAVRSALEGGSTLARRAAAEVVAARGAHMRESGHFDPELFFDGTTGEVKAVRKSPFETNDVVRARTTSGTGGIRTLLPLGTELEASMDGLRTETNSTFATVNPSYDAVGRLSLRQPLLRGFGPGTSSEATATGREEKAALARYDDVQIEVETTVEQVYWDLHAAERDLAVQQLIRDQAQALETQAELRARSGLVGPNDVATAKVFLAEQEQSLLDREEDLDQISDRLASLIGRRPKELPRFRAVDQPPTSFPIEPEETAVARALDRNLAIKARQEDLAAAQAREKGAAWNRYPKLDVLGSIGGTGLGGTPQDVSLIPGAQPVPVSGNKFDDAFTDVIHRDFPTWSAGVSLSIPIFLREGRGEHERLKGETERATQDLEDARRLLTDDVRTAHRALVRAAKRFEVAGQGVEASREQVRIGILQYNSGRTTAFELVRLGADLATAQQRYSQALVRTAKAAAALRFLTSGAYPASTSTGGNSRP